ncbi:zinc finger domain-containing protein [Streptomyces spiralis]
MCCARIRGGDGHSGPLAEDADDVELHPCPRCDVQPGSPCRSRGGAVAGAYHTGRFTKVPRLAKLLRVQTPADRGPGQAWRPGTPPPAPAVADTWRAQKEANRLISSERAPVEHGFADLKCWRILTKVGMNARHATLLLWALLVRRTPRLPGDRRSSRRDQTADRAEEPTRPSDQGSRPAEIKTKRPHWGVRGPLPVLGKS